MATRKKKPPTLADVAIAAHFGRLVKGPVPPAGFGDCVDDGRQLLLPLSYCEVEVGGMLSELFGASWLMELGRLSGTLFRRIRIHNESGQPMHVRVTLDPQLTITIGAPRRSVCGHCRAVAGHADDCPSAKPEPAK